MRSHCAYGRRSSEPACRYTLSWSCGAAERPRGQPSQSPSVTQTVAYGLQAVRSWIEETKDEPKITAADDIDKLMHDLEAYLTSRRDMDPALLPPPSFDRAIWTSLATVATFTVTVLGCLEAFTTSRSWWLGLATVCGALAIWLVVYRRWTGIRTPAIGGLLGVTAVSTLAAVALVIAALR